MYPIVNNTLSNASDIAITSKLKANINNPIINV